jgi:hypothetical protein
MRENTPVPEFVNLFRNPGIDSQPGGPIRQPYLTSARIDRIDSWAPYTFTNTDSERDEYNTTTTFMLVFSTHI